MAIRKSTRFPALVSSAAIIALALIPGAASAKTKPVDLQIETSTGVTLAAYTQYTGSTTAKADKRADCFGEDNPSSNKSYELKGASPLSALIDAESHDEKLSPLRLTDAFVDDGFGFGVCRVGDYSFSPVNFSYWYNANDYEASSTGPDLIPLKGGEHVLWYLTNGSESGFPSELELKTPVRAETGEDFTAKVVRHLSDGTSEPGTDVLVGNSKGYLPTDSEGKVELSALQAGQFKLQAIGGSEDASSNVARVCVAATLSKCSAHRGETIYGSTRADEIKAGKGDDEIRASGGDDEIDVHSGGADKVVCGSGEDTVIRAKQQSGLDLKGCEKVKRRSS
jgi:hypothetical protein